MLESMFLGAVWMAASIALAYVGTAVAEFRRLRVTASREHRC
jgi:hypothetical protein